MIDKVSFTPKVTWLERAMGQLKSHEGRFGLTLDGIYSKYVAETQIDAIYSALKNLRENGN